MTWYLSITPDEPFEAGKDERQRSVYALNVEAYKRISGTWHGELLKLLEDAGVGTREESLFASTKATIPDGEGPYVLVLDAPPGKAGAVTKGEPAANRLIRPRVRILCFAASSTVASATAHAVYNALLPVKNREVSA